MVKIKKILEWLIQKMKDCSKYMGSNKLEIGREIIVEVDATFNDLKE